MNGKIGPHEGFELDLLLKGEKPLAKFTVEGLDPDYEAQFELAINRGEILGFKFPSDRDRRLDRRYYCLPGEEWRVKLLELLYGQTSEHILNKFTEEELHRLDGALLGYSSADIDAFICKLRHQRSQGAE